MRTEDLTHGTVVRVRSRLLSYAVCAPAILVAASWIWFYAAWRYFPAAWRGTPSEQDVALFWASRLPFSLITGTIFVLGIVSVSRLLRRGEGLMSVILSTYYLAAIVAILCGSILFVPFKTIQ